MMPRAPLALLALTTLAAQPASDLLQSGIFTQDTKGDLDAAIRIYRQILDGGPGLRLYAAQAQFRLATCLLRKGDNAGAARAFQTIIDKYPAELTLVARARELMPRRDSLLPAPWRLPEVAEYRWAIPGVEDAWSVTRIGTAPGASRLLRIQMSFYTPQPNVTLIEMDTDTMAPAAAMYRGPSTPGSRLPARNMNPPAGVYALGSLFYVLRRMPLVEGWSAAIPIRSPGPIPETALDASVVAVEDVVVPAGKFRCYRLRLTATAKAPAPPMSTMGIDWPRTNNGETLWYAVEGARPLVKIEAGPARGELTALRTGEPTGITSYHDSQVGYSFTLPAGWLYHARKPMDGEGSSVDLIDPDSQTLVVIAGKSKRTDPANIVPELDAGAKALLGRAPGNSTRSYELHTVGGHQAITWVQNHGNGRVGYATWVQSQATRVSIRFSTDGGAAFESFRRKFQAILDSFRMP
jgi:hypothetical protein